MFSFGSRTQFHGLLIFCRFDDTFSLDTNWRIWIQIPNQVSRSLIHFTIWLLRELRLECDLVGWDSDLFIEACFIDIFHRFAYVCFAPGLLKEGLSLLHWMTMISMLVICVHTAIIYPYRLNSSLTLTHYPSSLQGVGVWCDKQHTPSLGGLY